MLNTRVEVATEATNVKLLESMEKSADVTRHRMDNAPPFPQECRG